MGFYPYSIIELRPGESYWRCKGTWGSYGKKLGSRRTREEVKMVTLENHQKVFDVVLSTQMISI